MKRGEIWTLRDDRYASKARPVVIVQSDLVEDFDSVVLVLFTSVERESVNSRVAVGATPENGLRKTSYVMTEKLFTVAKTELGEFVGTLTPEQMHAVSQKLVEVLAITAEDLP
jgi:mRNA interferase MazF